MFPSPLLTVITPSFTFHLAGLLSLLETHSSRFLPSKRMIASEGAAPQVAPGVTTAGTGSQTSVSSGLAPAGAWAKRGADTASRAAEARNRENGKRVMRRKYI